MNKVSPNELKKMARVFEASIGLVAQAIPRAFRLIRSLNAAVFDSVMVGIAKRLEVQPPPDPRKILQAYENLLQNDQYRQACERATADEENVKTRRNAAIDAFAAT